MSNVTPDKSWFWASAGAALVLAGAAMLWPRDRSDDPIPDGVTDTKPAPAPAVSEPLLVYCAAGIKPPVEAAAKSFEAAFGVPVRLQYGGSQTLLAGLELTKKGDLFIPGDEDYLQTARAKGLLDEFIPLARMRLVIGVKKGNPKGIKGVDDLLREGVKVALGDPGAAAIGKLTQAALTKTGQWEALRKHAVVFKPTSNEIAADVKLGSADAAVLWDAIIAQMPALEAVESPVFADATARIAVGVLRSSKQPTAALRFARWLASSDKGLPGFEKAGYKPVDGDEWTQMPELKLFAGAMLRPAIEKTLEAFEAREGVRITRVYNGCGVLVAQMKTGAMPDAYFACDASFMEQVRDRFGPATTVSDNRMIILVPKGNPHGIKGLADLSAAVRRLGLAHETQSALGALTKRMLEAAGVYDAVSKNVVVRSATGDFLVNQLRTGSLDATIVYVSNAALVKEHLDTVPIDGPAAVATQPYAVAADSKHKQLTGRLLEALRTAESRARFEALGFGWKP